MLSVPLITDPALCGHLIEKKNILYDPIRALLLHSVLSLVLFKTRKLESELCAKSLQDPTHLAKELL